MWLCVHVWLCTHVCRCARMCGGCTLCGCVHGYVHTCVAVCTRVWLCAHVWLCVGECVHVWVGVSTCVAVCMRVCSHVCGCVCARVRACMRTRAAGTIQDVSVVIRAQNRSLSGIRSVQRHLPGLGRGVSGSSVARERWAEPGGLQHSPLPALDPSPSSPGSWGSGAEPQPWWWDQEM